MSELQIVVLHYGDPKLTRQVVKELDNIHIPIQVLDNCAPLPYQEAWQRLQSNLYWGGALAYCLEQAKAAKFKYLWFCNNDISFVSAPPLAERVQARLKYLEKKLGRLGMYAPAVLHNPYHRQMQAKKGANFVQVNYIDGIAPIISLDLIEALGGLDMGENIYGYGLDVWLSLQASQAAWPVIVDHQVLIRHEYHKTASSVPGFLNQAATAEHDYLSARLGADWRNKLQELQACEVEI